MIKKLSILSIIINLVAVWQLAWGNDFNFRKIRWGMNQEDVTASEDLNIVEKNEELIKYKTQILNIKVDLIYLFVQNKLIGASYKLDENYLNSEHFIQTYKKFKEALEKKYGQPTRETTNWTNNRYKRVRAKWGLAVSLGQLDYVSVWDTPLATIKCSLRRENYNVLCLIEYASTEYKHLAEQMSEDTPLDPC